MGRPQTQQEKQNLGVKRYYHTMGKEHWRFGTWIKKEGQKQFFYLKRLTDVPKTDHILIKGDANPYDCLLYTSDAADD